jgi:MoaA/NifB/PqqE/SkfB family radical SAM enzyme
MNIEQIKKIELEITSDCNAACPGCARTLNIDKLTLNSFTLDDLIRLFPNTFMIAGKQFKFCGVLGDPALNVECVDMVKYLVQNGAYCELSTNGGVQTAEWWARLGSIAASKPGQVHVHFCLDGHKETNHIYRVNTKFNVIERNMAAYSSTAPVHSATWIYIVFDHNEHELAVAEAHAAQLGFHFATRTGMRNSYHTWLAQLTKKENKVIVKETKAITTSGSKEHSKKDAVQELDKFIVEYKTNKADNNKTQEILNSIVCKHIHEGEIFIASNQTLWPCCFLWDSAFKNSEKIIEKLEIFEPNWNSLRHWSIEGILQHPWYKELLAASWQPDHPLHFSRCIRTCAKNKAYHNEINYKDPKVSTV